MVFLRCDRNQLRATHLSVASHERHSMHEAGGSDDFVGRIAVKIQRFDRAAEIQGRRPCLNARQCPSQFRMMQIELDTAQLCEFGNFPENAEMLQVSLESKLRSRSVKSSVKA